MKSQIANLQENVNVLTGLHPHPHLHLDFMRLYSLKYCIFFSLHAPCGFRYPLEQLWLRN